MAQPGDLGRQLGETRGVHVKRRDASIHRVARLNFGCRSRGQRGALLPMVNRERLDHCRRVGLNGGNKIISRSRNTSEAPMRILARLMLASLLAASLQSAAVAQPKSGGTLVYGVTGEPPSTDCHAITTYAAVHVL